MATVSPTTTTPDAAVAATTPDLAGRLPRWLRHPLALAVASAGTLWLSFPPAEWHGAAWLALVPLFLAVADPARRPAVSFAGWLGGVVFWLLAVQWILATDSTAWSGWLAMALALSLFWLGFVWITRLILRRTRLPLTVVAPVVWVALEYVRAYTLTGFPWYYLAHSQYRQVYWTQIADFAGSLGVSFLIALVNSLVVELIAPYFYAPGHDTTPGLVATWARLPRGQWVRLGSVLVSVGATLGYGIYRVQSATFRPGPRVAMLQSSEVQEMNPERRKSSLTLHQMYLQMVDNAMARKPKPDLIVWPETAFPFGLVTIDPEIPANTLDQHVKRYDPESIGADWARKRDASNAEFRRLLDRTRTALMVGLTTYDFGVGGPSKYNSAVLFRPGAQPQSYHKLHLVPFGEYVPLIGVFPWIVKFTPFDFERLPTLDFGDAPSWFDLGPYRLGAVICFEDTVPQVVRRLFSEVPDAAQPDLLVNLSNDGWFHATAEHEMHLAVSTFRCVENRVPMARAVNTGVSAMIDGNGAIVRELGKNKQDVLDVAAPLDDRTSLYSRWGDWLGQATILGTLGFVVLGLIAPKTPQPPVEVA